VVLEGLARSAGPFGPAMAIALAHGAAAVGEHERATAADAVIHLAGTSGIDAALLGRELAHLLVVADAATDRVAGTLALIGQRGAWHVVWAVAHTVVPALLRLDQPPAGTAALLAVAADAATATGARAVLPEVETASARADGSRLAAEAGRLARTIG
jgi:hypothetical protein